MCKLFVYPDLEKPMAKILVVDDDEYLAENVADYLKLERHVVETAFTGRDGLALLDTYQYDLLILDWQLPDISGPEMCEKLRAQGAALSILMLTGKGDIASKECGLDSGADDYLTKPFHPRELGARIRTLLRRPQTLLKDVLTIGNLTLDLKSYEVTRAGSKVQLLPKEIALLEFLMRHPDEVFSIDALLDRIWSSESDASENTVRTHMYTLRKKLGPDDGSPSIKTVHRVGYKLET